MSKDDIRREEDFFASIGLTICDGCAKKGSCSCRHCRHNYDSLYEQSEVLKLVREK